MASLGSPKQPLLNKETSKKSRNCCCIMLGIGILCILAYIIYLFITIYQGGCDEQENCFDCIRSTDFCPWCSKCQWCSETNSCQKDDDSSCPSNATHSNCSFAFAPIEPYNESIARYLVDYAFAAYVDNPENCLNNSEVFYRTKAQCDFQGGPCIAYIAMDHEIEVVILSFQGSETSEQMLVQGIDYFKEYQHEGENGSVTKYYKEALDAIWPCLLPKLRFLHSQHPQYELWVTGHSLGGALASVAAFEAVYTEVWPRDKVKLVTFGEPRIGDFEYAKEHDALLSYSWRVVHAKDPIPHIPSCLSVRGNCLLTSSQPYHHGLEVWYPDSMEPDAPYKECRGAPHNEDGACSNGLHYVFKYKQPDHRFYFKHRDSVCPEESRNKQERIFSDTCQDA